MKVVVARVLFALAILLLLALAYTGIAGGIDQFDQSSHSEYTVGQIVQTVLQLVFGVLSLACIAVWFWARRWSRAVLVAWAVSLGLAAGLASVAWGRTSIAVGIASGVAALLIAWGVAWLLHFGARGGA